MFIPTLRERASWEDYTLVVPAVSVGNIGQLTADLLISTLWMDRVGYLYDDCFLPVIGNDPFSTTDTGKDCSLVTAVEVYQSEEQKLVCIQQRVPLVKGKKMQYIKKLMDWIKECKFKQVHIISSTFAHERIEKQLRGTQYRFLATPKLLEERGASLRDECGWVELERRTPLEILAGRTQEAGQGDAKEIFMPGGGIAKPLFEMCCGEKLSALVTLNFCSEGDNAIEALQMAAYINTFYRWIDVEKCRKSTQHTGGWRVPSSWKLTFGSRFEQHIFL